MAGSIAANAQTAVYFGDYKGFKSRFVVTCDNNGAANNLQVPYDLAGQFLYSVTCGNGATGPLDNSDLYITEDSEAGADILGGSGENQADNATTNTFRPLVNNVAAAVPIYGNLFVKINNSNIASGVSVITLRTVPRMP